VPGKAKMVQEWAKNISGGWHGSGSGSPAAEGKGVWRIFAI